MLHCNAYLNFTVVGVEFDILLLHLSFRYGAPIPQAFLYTARNTALFKDMIHSSEFEI